VSALQSLIADVTGLLEKGGEPGRELTLSRVTDLLIREAPRVEPQTQLFDEVLGSIVPRVAVSARARLAERLADLSYAPPGTMRALASDDAIIVARPVLTRSPVLRDPDLLAVAKLRGPQHMLAICNRPILSETVTDMLVAEGDGRVRHAATGNPGARLSPVGKARLLDLARDDDRLQELLGERTDLSVEDSRLLVVIAKESARARFRSSIGEPAPIAPRGLSAEYEQALASMRALAESGDLTEAHLVALAAEGNLPASICALAVAAALPVQALQRVFEQRDNDMLLILGKAQGWSWGTMRALLRLRDPSLSHRHQFRRAEDAFDGIASATAKRVVQVLASREGGPSRPDRTAVRSA
jgi:uncharacterized protein (DUF2336 family)